jgi:polyisoprenoid-binding protein YceI
MKQSTLAAALILAAALNTFASPITFDFRDPKGVNNVVFQLDAPLEAINGSASGVSGKVTFDPADPSKVSGKLVVSTSSMHLGNPTQNEHMLGDKWMDAAKFPEITFEAKQAKNVKTSADVTSADVEGILTIKGIAKPVTVPAKITYLKDKLKQRSGKEGDLLVIRSKFGIKRADFGLNPGQMEDKVSDTIELTISVAGSAPK